MSRLETHPSRRPWTWIRRSGALMALTVLIVAFTGRSPASDPPHWLGAETYVDCTSNCHVLHQAAGGALTQAAGNVALCQSCHNSTNLPIADTDKATPGTIGTSHGFDVAAVNAQFGANPPTDKEMSLRVMDGNVVCSTCHNQHDAGTSGTTRIRDASPVTQLGGTGSVSSAGTFTGSGGAWYLIEIDGEGSQSTATFRWSKDNGITWMGTGVPTGDGSPVSLGADGVQVVFTGGDASAFVVGEQSEFYATRPFLRATLDNGDNSSADKFCRDCHSDWVMTHDGAGGTRTWDDTFKSHPVGVALTAEYDRGAPLDGDGSTNDGNPTNNLKLDASNNVQCITCHGVHYADSVTQTVDEYTP